MNKKAFRHVYIPVDIGEADADVNGSAGISGAGCEAAPAVFAPNQSRRTDIAVD